MHQCVFAESVAITSFSQRREKRENRKNGREFTDRDMSAERDHCMFVWWDRRRERWNVCKCLLVTDYTYLFIVSFWIRTKECANSEWFLMRWSFLISSFHTLHIAHCPLPIFSWCAAAFPSEDDRPISLFFAQNYAERIDCAWIGRLHSPLSIQPPTVIIIWIVGFGRLVQEHCALIWSFFVFHWQHFAAFCTGSASHSIHLLRIWSNAYLIQIVFVPFVLSSANWNWPKISNGISECIKNV